MPCAVPSSLSDLTKTPKLGVRETGSSSQSDYFAAPLESNPLIHSWSLAVEEQFYLVFPPLVLAAARWFPRALPWLIGAVFFWASLAATQWLDSAANFYLLPTRAWELMLGALLAFGELNDLRKTGGVVAAVGVAAGLAALTASIALFDANTPYPGWRTLAPTLGAAAIIWFAGGDDIGSRVLRWGPLVGVGLVSYSLYLWHQPLLAFARLADDETLVFWAEWLSLLVSLVLATITWSVIERPFRNRALIPTWVFVLVICVR